eukprot:5047515-Prymnesium_polylepis.2
MRAWPEIALLRSGTPLKYTRSAKWLSFRPCSPRRPRSTRREARMAFDAHVAPGAGEQSARAGGGALARCVVSRDRLAALCHMGGRALSSLAPAR